LKPALEKIEGWFMRRFFILIACFFSAFINADSTTFSRDRLTLFYEGFLCEEKQTLSSVGLASPCSSSQNPFVPPTPPTPPTPVPPSNPPPPPFQTGLLPVVIVNNSGLPDSEVFILLTGVATDGLTQVWGNINTASGITTLQNVALIDNSTTFSYPLSALPVASGGHVFYVPQIRSALIWFSMNTALSMTVVSVAPEVPPLQIVQPNFTNPSDTNYTTNFDIYEFAFLLAGSPQVAADATAVSFFSLPLYGYLSGATTASSTTGLYQPRSYIMSQAATILNTAPEPERAQWNNLFLTSSGQILRFVSTGKAIAASLFDANYLDDASAYGYSYIEDIWTGASSFYVNNNLNLTVTVTDPSTATYTYAGRVQPDNTFLFISSDGGPEVTFPVPTLAPPATSSTTFDIFSAINFITPLPTAGTAADAVSKLVQESIIAGLVPTTNTLSLAYLPANQANYYTVNSNLSPAGQTTGPWYDLYSKALHSLGSIYTYGFDEPLWPQVLIGAPFTDGFTYLGITIGSVD
jgi:Beta-1,3-glucanase